MGAAALGVASVTRRGIIPVCEGLHLGRCGGSCGGWIFCCSREAAVRSRRLRASCSENTAGRSRAWSSMRRAGVIWPRTSTGLHGL